MENFFKLKEHGTDVKTEVIAGLTTFMTMAYILAVNPSILGATGMDTGAIFTATALASAIGSFCMALFANLPFVLSAGMGLNAYFAYTVVLGMGYSWEVALTAVFVEGIIFIILSLTNVREAIFNAIPASLKVAVSVGIGLFITFIGLQNAHIVVDGSTLVGLFSFNGSVKAGTFQSEGITVVLALIGLLITAFLVIKNVKGNILLGILITWVLGIICQLTGLYVPNAEAGFYSLIPSGIISAPASVAPTLFKMDFSAIASLNFVVVVFAFLFVDIFDTLGTLIGCATKANMLDKEGKLPGIKGALMADAVGTTVGACLGTSTITTFVENRSDLYCFRITVHPGTVLLSGIPCNSFLCNRSCTDRCWFLHDAVCSEDQLERYAGSNSCIHLHFCNALHVFYFRRYFVRRYFLRCTECGSW